jgi:hypothetical protein
MIDDTTFAGLAGSLGVTPDPVLGHITLDIRDCDEVAAPGVTFSATNLGAKSAEFYNLGGAFVPKDGSSKTDKSGQAISSTSPPPAA